MMSLLFSKELLIEDTGRV